MRKSSAPAAETVHRSKMLLQRLIQTRVNPGISPKTLT
jgi:hypothetical protein